MDSARNGVARSTGQASARSAVRFSDIPLDWSDFRLALRQTADILYRHDAMDRADHERILALSRDGNALEPLVKQWYFATSHCRRQQSRRPRAGMDRRPASIRCCCCRFVRSSRGARRRLLPRPEFSGWHHRHCPICGWEPEFGVITPNADRRLICGRCLGQWTFDQFACPFCDNADRGRASRRLRRATGVTACTRATCAANT